MLRKEKEMKQEKKKETFFSPGAFCSYTFYTFIFFSFPKYYQQH
jgi:hypothetical protein